jgi:hypothetical protein
MLSIHCKEDSICVFPEVKLRGLVPNFYIHTSVSNLYIPKIRSTYFAAAKKGRPIVGIYKSLTDI